MGNDNLLFDLRILQNEDYSVWGVIIVFCFASKYFREVLIFLKILLRICILQEELTSQAIFMSQFKKYIIDEIDVVSMTEEVYTKWQELTDQIGILEWSYRVSSLLPLRSVHFHIDEYWIQWLLTW